MITRVGAWARAVVLAALVNGGLSSASAQTGREALAQGTEAYDRAEFQTAVRLLSRGLDPMTGQQDSLWGAGIHMLADALIEQGAASLADVWIRWALRIAPEVNVDSINFPPAVTNAFLAARRAIGESSADSATASVAWEWSNTAGSPTRGAIRVTRGEALVTAELRGGGSVRAGEQRAVAAGVYLVVATATDYLPSQVTIEVLPGVTTVLDFELQPATGLLYVVSRPWGDVYLDGVRLGYTTLAARKVPVGPHRLRIQRDGYVPFDTTITIYGDQRLRLGPIQLRPERR